MDGSLNKDKSASWCGRSIATMTFWIANDDVEMHVDSAFNFRGTPWQAPQRLTSVYRNIVYCPDNEPTEKIGHTST